MPTGAMEDDSDVQEHPRSCGNDVEEERHSAAYDAARDATELHSVQSQQTDQDQASATVQRQKHGLLEKLQAFWKHQVSLVVPHRRARDFLGTHVSF